MDHEENRPLSSSATASDWLSQVVVREIRQDDLPALEWDGEYRHLRRVYAHAYHSHRSGQAMLWVAELAHTGIIGQIFLQLNSERLEWADGINRAHIYSFRIKPAYRGSGLGSLMLQKAEDFLIARSYRYVTLNVAKNNPEAQRLYERHGFRIVAHEAGCWTYPDDKGIWQDVVDPAWRMEKSLS